MYYRNLVFFLLVWGISFASGQNCFPQDSVARIEFVGLKHTKEALVQRYIKHQNGFFYDSTLAQQEVNALFDLGIFAEIKTQCPANGHGGVILQYHFLELFKYLPAPALKQSDQDGWMLGAAFAALNFGGQAVRLELQMRTSVKPWWQSKEFAFYGKSPWLANAPLDWDGEFIKTNSWDALRQFSDDSYYANFAGNYPLSKRCLLWGQIGFKYVNHTEDLAWLRAANYDYTPRVGIGFIYDSRDAKHNPQTGVYSEWSLSQSGGFLGGAGDFQEYLWDLRGFYPSKWGLWVGSTLLRWRPGQMAFYDYLYQGGANTLRAYDSSPEIVGQHEVITNFEYQFPLLKRQPVNLSGVQAFYALNLVVGADGALLWTETLGSENLRSSIYAGLHLILPAINRLRVEYGYSPRHKNWNISVGLFEKSITQRWRSR
ncbi:MAG: BamA/TamA family outer membrane protein [Fibrobacter sp.]|nr:BamA/TamA family outer membrane protein [Fibrobacter sp.]